MSLGRVVYDVHVLVLAVSGGNSPFRSWPSPPPVTDNACADCLGIANDAREFSLLLSDHILTNTARVLSDGLGWDAEHIEDYLTVLVDIARASGGEVMTPTSRIGDCPDYEDNRILELALDGGASLIVSDDTDLTSMSPWRGVPVLRAREFAGRVDAMRLHRRR